MAIERVVHQGPDDTLATGEKTRKCRTCGLELNFSKFYIRNVEGGKSSSLDCRKCVDVAYEESRAKAKSEKAK